MPMSELAKEGVMRLASAFAFAALVSFGLADAVAQQSNAPGAAQPPAGQQPGQMQMGPGMDHQMMQRQPSGQQQPGPGQRGSGMGQERMPQRMEHQGMGQGPRGRAMEGPGGTQQHQPQGDAPVEPPKQK